MYIAGKSIPVTPWIPKLVQNTRDPTALTRESVTFEPTQNHQKPRTAYSLDRHVSTKRSRDTAPLILDEGQRN